MAGLTILTTILALAACEAPPPTVDAPLPAAAPASAPVAATADHSHFEPFFDDFRAAVLAGDREAVANMASLPFIDYDKGYCEERDLTRCPSPPESATARTRAEFMTKYDLIFTPAVIAAIRDRKVREGVAEDEYTAPAVLNEEYYLDLEDTGQQRVFSREAGDYKLSRVPFYS